MLHRQRSIPASIRPLLDNLDAALGACVEIVSATNPHDLLRLELTAIAHVLQAREHMRELQSADGAITSQIALFLAVTDCLEQKASGGASTAPLEAAANQLIAGQIPVTTLIALAAAMRDVLELCRATFEEDAAAALHRPVPISEMQVWATGPEAG
jgi:hypothetical protein